MSFTCRFCGEKFCSEHRLPENHGCDSMEEKLEEEREAEEWFVEKDVREDLKPGAARKPARNSLARDVWDTLSTSVTLAIISVTAAAFVLQAVVPGFTDFLSFSPALTQQAVSATNAAASQTGFGPEFLTKTVVEAPWTLVTVLLAHAGFFHIFANMVTFYFFGTPLEKTIGSRELLKFYVGSGIASVLGYLAFRNLLYYTYGPVLNGVPTLTPAVGASGAVVATFAVIAVLYPRAEVLLYFFIPMKIKTALHAFAAIEGVNLVMKAVGVTLPLIGNFASSAHLTGLIIGVWYGRKLREKYSHRMGTLDLLGY